MNTTPAPDDQHPSGIPANGQGGSVPGAQPGHEHRRGQSGQGGGSFFTWLRSTGIVRSDDRWFTGVAGGIAAKIGIDPLIVRGVFVVLALLGGPGLLFYLAGWLLLPDTTGRIHVEEIIRGRASAGVLTAAIVFATIVVLPALIGIVAPAAGSGPLFSIWSWGVWDLFGFPEWLRSTIAWLFWIAVLVGGGLLLRSVLLKRGRNLGGATAPADAAGAQSGEPVPDPAPGPAAATGASYIAGPHGTEASGGGGPYAGTSAGPSTGTSPEDWARNFGERADQWGRDFGKLADRWGADVGRQADEWSARYAEHHDAHKLGAAHIIITLACALLAGGAAALWAVSTGIDPVNGRIDSEAAPALIVGITAALAILAVSLIIAGIRGKHTGWVGFLSFCGAVALFVAVALPGGSTFQPFGNITVDGRSAPGTVMLAGNSTVDLRDLGSLEAGSAEGSNSEIVLWQLAGNTEVILPERAAAEIELHVLAGRINDYRRDIDAAVSAEASGIFLGRTIAVEAPSTETEQSNRRSASDDGNETSTRDVDAPVEVSVYLLGGNIDITGGAQGSSTTSYSTTQREEATR